MQGFETCNAVQTCIEHVHKGNIILMQIIFTELRPFELLTHFGTICSIGGYMVLSVSVQPFRKYIQLSLETCNLVQACIDMWIKETKTPI